MTAIELVHEMRSLEKGLLDFAMKLTRDRVEASDLYQETTYRAIKNYHLFKSNKNLKGWLMTIMRNLFINAYRKKKIRQTYFDNTGNDYLIDSSSKVVSNQGELDVNYEELTDLVDSLEEYLKIPFMMAFEGYKYEEIAEELGAPLGTIKSRIYIAKRKLRKMIKHQYAIVGELEMA